MANRFNLTDEIDRMKAYEAKTAIPLPEPDSRWHPSWDMPSTYTADQMHAHAAAVSAAARDCRTCEWCKLDDESPCRMDCTDADRYQPLPPVRLWRTT